MKPYLQSLTGRMVFGLMAIHLLLIPFLFGGVLLIVKQGYEDQFIDHARSDALSFASLAAQDSSEAHLKALAEETIFTGRALYVGITDQQGRQIALASNNETRPPQIEDFFFGQHDDGIYFISLPLRKLNGDITAAITLGYDEAAIAEAINVAYWRGLYLALTYILLTFGLLAFLMTQLTKPLRYLRATSREIARGHFNVELNVATNLTELKSLADDLNAMRVELVKQATALEFQALHDTLTGLPNRVLLRDRFRHALSFAARNEQGVTLLLIDLDHFKEVNDTLGHMTGDLILQQVAARLQQGARESDTVARLGGDEFALLLLMKEQSDIEAIARKLLTTIRRPYEVEQQLLHVGASLGAAIYPVHGVDFESLLRRADIAMYESKRTHAGFTVYESKLDRHSLSQLTLSSELRESIERCELELHYQPKVNIRTGEVQGAEALVRWPRPDGLMMPDHFIPIAEKTGSIMALTDWVLNESLAQCRRWNRMGIKINVAVNVSTRCLQDEHFPEDVAALLNRNGISPACLELELTESTLMADPVRAEASLARLHAMGVRAAIDDFGTGYSSLDHLKRLPVSEIKIDKSFVIDMFSNEDDAAIVQAVIALARNLGLTAVAEGVEHARTLELLRELGCDFVQGNFVSPPLNARGFEAWYRNCQGRFQAQTGDKNLLAPLPIRALPLR